MEAPEACNAAIENFKVYQWGKGAARRMNPATRSNRGQADNAVKIAAQYAIRENYRR